MADASTAPRALPHDIHAEMGVLGSMMLSPDAIYLGRERVESESFYKVAHQDIFRAIVSLADARNTVDLILLRDELKRQGKLDKVGGRAYLTELMEAVPTSANAEYYIEIVRDHAIRRQLIDTATGIQKSCYEDAQDAEDLLNDAESKMLAVRHMKESHRVSDMTALLQAILADQAAKQSSGGMLTGLPTGFKDLDDLTNGLQTGEFIVVAARPSVGKTSLALNILNHLCIDTDDRRPAVLYSLEVQARQIVSNLLCIHNEIDTQDFRRGTMDDADWKKIEKSLKAMAEIPLYIDDSPSLRIGDLRARARRMHHEHGVELIVVDYLQLLQPGRYRDSRATEVSEISAGLKALARELEVPVLAVSQLNRAVEREQRQPRMSDLRESGAIEQDADVVMLLHRPDMMEEEEQQPDRPVPAGGVAPSNADLIVAKQRNGPTGICRLGFWRRNLIFRPRHANV